MQELTPRPLDFHICLSPCPMRTSDYVPYAFFIFITCLLYHRPYYFGGGPGGSRCCFTIDPPSQGKRAYSTNPTYSYYIAYQSQGKESHAQTCPEQVTDSPNDTCPETQGHKPYLPTTTSL